MSLFLITGSAGTGKSTVCEMLKARGYIAYNVDNDGLARWTNLDTGYVHPKSSVKLEARTPEFIKTHGWFVPRHAAEEVSQEAEGQLGFLCGVIDNYDDLSSFFNGIIAHYIEDETLISRLSKRSPREWGTQEHELRQTLERHHIIYDKWKDLGAVIVDSSEPQEIVVDNIIKAARAISTTQ